MQQKNFSMGFGSQWNPASWAQMPVPGASTPAVPATPAPAAPATPAMPAQPVQGVPTPVGQPVPASPVAQQPVNTFTRDMLPYWMRHGGGVGVMDAIRRYDLDRFSR